MNRDIRALKLDIQRHTDDAWTWQVSENGKMLCISSKSYGSKAACCKAAYRVQDRLANARVFIENKEVM